DNYRRNWIIMILPYFEQQTTFDRFDFTRFISDSVNRQARGISISTLLCSSDTGQDVPYAGLPGSSEGDNWARGNYAANATSGLLLARNWSGGAPHCAHCGFLDSGQRIGPSIASGWTDDRQRGVMGACTAVPMRKITDGLSHTMLL